MLVEQCRLLIMMSVESLGPYGKKTATAICGLVPAAAIVLAFPGGATEGKLLYLELGPRRGNIGIVGSKHRPFRSGTQTGWPSVARRLDSIRQRSRGCRREHPPLLAGERGRDHRLRRRCPSHQTLVRPQLAMVKLEARWRR